MPKICKTIKPWLLITLALATSKIGADSFNFQLVTGKNSGEQVSERSMTYYDHFIYLFPIGIRPTQAFGTIFGLQLSNVRKTVYRRDTPYLGLKLNYSWSAFKFTAGYQTNLKRQAGHAYQNNAFHCSIQWNCKPQKGQIDLNRLSLRDSAHRLNIPLARSDAPLDGDSNLKEESITLQLNYSPFLQREKQKGLYLSLGVQKSSRNYRIVNASEPHDTFKHVFKYPSESVIYIPGTALAYSVRSLLLSPGIGYHKSFSAFEFDSWLAFNISRSSNHGTSRATTTPTHNEWRQELKGMGFQYRFTLAYRLEEQLKIGAAFRGNHLYSEGKEITRGGINLNIIIANEVARHFRDKIYSSPVYTGLKDDGVEFFIERDFSFN